MVKSIAISGPMEDYDEYNYPAFNDMARRLRNLGWIVENPAETKLPKGLPWELYMIDFIPKMIQCDCLILLDGYQSSRGSTLELHIMSRLNKKILYWFEDSLAFESENFS